MRRSRSVGMAVNVAAVAWLAFESVNIAWPRAQLAPPGAPAYQVWAAPILLATIAAVGLAYLVLARPHERIRRLTAADALADQAASVTRANLTLWPSEILLMSDSLTPQRQP